MGQQLTNRYAIAAEGIAPESAAVEAAATARALNLRGRLTSSAGTAVLQPFRLAALLLHAAVQRKVSAPAAQRRAEWLIRRAQRDVAGVRLRVLVRGCRQPVRRGRLPTPRPLGLAASRDRASGMGAGATTTSGVVAASGAAAVTGALGSAGAAGAWLDRLSTVSATNSSRQCQTISAASPSKTMSRSGTQGMARRGDRPHVTLGRDFGILGRRRGFGPRHAAHAAALSAAPPRRRAGSAAALRVHRSPALEHPRAARHRAWRGVGHALRPLGNAGDSAASSVCSRVSLLADRRQVEEQSLHGHGQGLDGRRPVSGGIMPVMQ